MADKRRRTLAKLGLRALLPSITPGLVFRAILGAILFICGIIYGVWLIIRFRRRGQDDAA